MNAKNSNYLTTQQLVEKNDWLTMRRLRTLLEQREENGLSEHVRCLTKRLLLIEENGFNEWLDQRPSGKGQGGCPK